MPDSNEGRRSTDPGGDRDIYSEVSALTSAVASVAHDVKKIDRKVDAHIDEHDGVDLRTIAANVNLIVDWMYGAEEHGPDGTVSRSGGAREIVAQAMNGGIRIHIPGPIIALMVAMIGALGVIGAALLSRPPG